MEDYYEKLKKMTREELYSESNNLIEEHSKIMSELDEAREAKDYKKYIEISNKFDEVDRKMILLAKVLRE